MSTDVSYDCESGLMHTRAFGTLTIDDLADHPKKQIAAAPEKLRMVYELLDAREIETIAATNLMLVPFVPKMLGELKRFDGIRLAILCDEDWVAGQANQLAALFMRSIVVVRVFRRKDEALAWLKEQRAV